MQRNINSLIGYKMEGTDGEIGKVEEFYFDDETWTVRYLILETGGWFSGREVLISPQALQKKPWVESAFPVNLTKEQIVNSPDIDTAYPVSRQQEIELQGYYPWQSYWGQGYNVDGVWGHTFPAPLVVEDISNDGNLPKGDQHLRSTKEITGYHIHAEDGDIGHVKDFIIDDETWKILYIVIDTNNWIGGNKVLLGVEHIKKIEWGDEKVFVDVNIESIKSAIHFDESTSFLTKINDTVLSIKAFPLLEI